MGLTAWALEEGRLWDEYQRLLKQAPRDMAAVSAAYEAHRQVLPGAQGYAATGNIKDYCWGHGTKTTPA